LWRCRRQSRWWLSQCVRIRGSPASHPEQSKALPSADTARSVRFGGSRGPPIRHRGIDGPFDAAMQGERRCAAIGDRSCRVRNRGRCRSRRHADAAPCSQRGPPSNSPRRDRRGACPMGRARRGTVRRTTARIVTGRSSAGAMPKTTANLTERCANYAAGAASSRPQPALDWTSDRARNLACVDETPSSALRCMFGESKGFVASRIDGSLARISRAELRVTGGKS
jgi:hypothetical protein